MTLSCSSESAQVFIQDSRDIEEESGKALITLTLLPSLPGNDFPAIEENEKSLTYSAQIHT